MPLKMEANDNVRRKILRLYMRTTTALSLCLFISNSRKWMLIGNAHASFSHPERRCRARQGENKESVPKPGGIWSCRFLCHIHNSESEDG